MPQTDRHKEREIPIEFDFYNTLKSFEHTDHIPRNESGKVVRSQLVEDYLKRHADTCSSSSTKGEKHGE